MDTYSILREIADSWVLLLMTLFFLGVIAWAFRPGSRDTHAEISLIPLRDDPPLGCARNCPDCACRAIPDLTPGEKS